jgi:YidC/Oxa1 family membrane protein insertase
MSGIFGPLSDFFFAILRFLHENLNISWAWAIVVLTVIVRVVLVPLTWRQIKSMRAMQALQPQLKALQAKYQNDKQLLNQKVMEFYRENKVNPFGSCLPLLFQMPVFIGLFYMLRNQGQVYEYFNAGAFASVWHSHPISWLWIADITTFDLLLMFLYIASQFAASWQTARNSAGQQKMIAYLMPIIVGIFMYMYKWPAGLFIYWFTSNLWTIAQQFVAEKIMPVHVVAIPDKEKTTPKRPGGKTPVRASGKSSKQPAGKTQARPAGKAPTRPAGKSGGKTSGQKTGQKAKTAGGKSQRPNSGTGNPKGSSGT